MSAIRPSPDDPEKGTECVPVTEFMTTSQSSSAAQDKSLDMIGNGKADDSTSTISKGVILNALHTGQLEDGVGKPVHLSNVFAMADPAPKDNTAKSDTKEISFRDMSVGRKVAFGFSFLPSIMFVLCFSVILPCQHVVPPEPCVQHTWIWTANRTEPISIELTQMASVLISEDRGSLSILTNLNDTSGQGMWENKFDHKILHTECGFHESGSEDSCLLQDETGKLHFLTVADGSVRKITEETLTIDKDEVPSSPVILPPCSDDDSMPVVGISTSKSILFRGKNTRSVGISNCDGVRTRLVPWIRNNVTDLLLACSSNKKELLTLIPETKWCKNNTTKPENNAITLVNRDVISNILPTEDGLFVWTRSYIFMFGSNSTLMWKTSTQQHLEKRSLLYGKFDGLKQHLVLLSSNSTGTMQVSLLDVVDGKILWNQIISNAYLIDAVTVKGKDKDLAVVLKKTDLTSIVEAGESVASTLTLQDAAKYVQQKIGLSLVQLDGSYVGHPLYDWDAPKDELFDASFKTRRDASEKELTIFVAHSSIDGIAEVRSLSITNWELASTEGTCKIHS